MKKKMAICLPRQVENCEILFSIAYDKSPKTIENTIYYLHYNRINRNAHIYRSKTFFFFR